MLHQPSRILVAVRVGDEVPEPGPTAAWLATRLGAETTLVCVATELRTAPEIEAAAAIADENVRVQMIDAARRRTEEWGRSALGELPFDVVIEEGAIAERIAATAERIGADLVVAGSSGRGAVRGMILGDTAREIIRHSPCPVVIVPPGVEAD